MLRYERPCREWQPGYFRKLPRPRTTLSKSRYTWSTLSFCPEFDLMRSSRTDVCACMTDEVFSARDAIIVLNLKNCKVY
jgi:hypothetical protein